MRLVDRKLPSVRPAADPDEIVNKDNRKAGNTEFPYPIHYFVDPDRIGKKYKQSDPEDCQDDRRDLYF